jgi:hypothetical protein
MGLTSEAERQIAAFIRQVGKGGRIIIFDTCVRYVLDESSWTAWFTWSHELSPFSKDRQKPESPETKAPKEIDQW